MRQRREQQQILIGIAELDIAACRFPVREELNSFRVVVHSVSRFPLLSGGCVSPAVLGAEFCWRWRVCRVCRVESKCPITALV